MRLSQKSRDQVDSLSSASFGTPAIDIASDLDHQRLDSVLALVEGRRHVGAGKGRVQGGAVTRLAHLGKKEIEEIGRSVKGVDAEVDLRPIALRALLPRERSCGIGMSINDQAQSEAIYHLLDTFLHRCGVGIIIALEKLLPQDGVPIRISQQVPSLAPE